MVEDNKKSDVSVLILLSSSSWNNSRQSQVKIFVMF